MSTITLALLLANVPVLDTATSSPAAPSTRPAEAGTAPLPLRSHLLVTTDWLAGHLDAADVVVVHVARRSDAYEQGHIPGARLLEWHDIAVTRDGVLNELPPLEQLVAVVRRLGITHTSRVILYDDETGIQAARAYFTLDYLGLGDRASLLDGQLKKWRAEQRPLSQAEPVVERSDFVPRPRPEVLVDLRTMRDLVWAKNESAGTGIALVDARPEEEYTGQRPDPRVRRPGHIPGAVNVPSAGCLQSEDMPTLRPVEELRRQLAQAGLSTDDRVVVYCNSGGNASAGHFLLKYLGYDVQLYDGSFSQWSSVEDTPVEP